MGCANSKRSRCRHCHSPYEPIPRSYSMHVHHPPQQKGDSYHVVALTSTTLGSLKLESSIDENNQLNGDDGIEENNKKNGNENSHPITNERSLEFSMGVIEAKTWSSMINEKIPKIVPKTPIRTPPGEPETINIWELMEGLEDRSPLRPLNHIRSFSFDVVRSPTRAPFDRPKSKLQENGTVSPKTIWLQIADNDSISKSIISEFDPEVISTFRKSLQELSPDNPFHLRPLDSEKQEVTDKQLEDTDTKKVNDIVADHKRLSYGKDKVVVYFTSLRGVRKTYEDCCNVRVILKGLGVRVDERDVSLHSGFKEELRDLLGDGFNGGGLPRVFVGSKYIGGADEIRRLHEDGKLEKVLEGCEMVDGGGGCGGGGGVCEACGDVRFVPCETCSGSCKIYYEGDEDGEGDGDDGGEEGCEYGFQRCPDCNENGLIRCPICCY
ncbi:hypothetical protein L1049_002309 [Liquidambar formosana]|uniref:Glutaredoxin domain-containing protein n=1 Tax=Liquidambar formosana TaxID=63359 RepID=A0AAP0NH32_LIQFO